MASIYLPPIARKKKVDGCPRYVLTLLLLLKYLNLVMMKSLWIPKINRTVCGQAFSHSSLIKTTFRFKPCVPQNDKKTNGCKGNKIVLRAREPA